MDGSIMEDRAGGGPLLCARKSKRSGCKSLCCGEFLRAVRVALLGVIPVFIDDLRDPAEGVVESAHELTTFLAPDMGASAVGRCNRGARTLLRASWGLLGGLEAILKGSTDPPYSSSTHPEPLHVGQSGLVVVSCGAELHVGQ